MAGSGISCREPGTPLHKTEVLAARLPGGGWREGGREALKVGQCGREVTGALIRWLITHGDSQASAPPETDFHRLRVCAWGRQVNLKSKSFITWLYLGHTFQGFKDGHSIPSAKVRQQSMVIWRADSGARSPEFQSQLCCVTLGKRLSHPGPPFL